MTESGNKADHAPLLERAFSIDLQEGTYEIDGVEGNLPPLPSGVCYLNGPGSFSRAGLAYRHWLDGDGLACALAVDGGRLRFTSRFVRSLKRVEESRAGRPIYRTFGTAFPGDALRRGVGLASPVNVSLYRSGARLLAFGEQGLPWELDPRTLDTKGEFTFGGQLNELTPFSAHPKIDRETGELFNFGVSFAADRPRLNVFRFSSDERLIYRRRIELPYASSIHDFALNGRHIIFYVSPLLLDMSRLLAGATLMEALSWEPSRGSVLLVVERETGEVEARIPIGGRYCLHLINAFDQPDGRLVVDVLEGDRPLYDQYEPIPDLFEDVGEIRPVRLVVDPASWSVVDRRELPYGLASDLPSIDGRLTGRSYRRFWMLGIGACGQPGRKFFDQLVGADWDDGRVDVYQAPAGQYLGGEPLYLGPEKDTTSGVVLCQVFDAAAAQSWFAVFEATRVGRGPVARIPLAHPVPPLFHSSFTAA